METTESNVGVEIAPFTAPPSDLDNDDSTTQHTVIREEAPQLSEHKSVIQAEESYCSDADLASKTPEKEDEGNRRQHDDKDLEVSSSSSPSLLSQSQSARPHQHSDDNKQRYKQYLIDRANGNSRIGTSRPPCGACWVPLPVIWFAPLIEQNRIFEKMGKFGAFSPDNLRARKRLIGLGLACNICALILSIFVVCSVSDDHEVIVATAFTSGLVDPTNQTFHPFQYNVRLGIRAVAFTNLTQNSSNVVQDGLVDCLFIDGGFCVVEKGVVSFDQFCDVVQDDWLVFDDPDQCSNCQDVSGAIIVSLFVSIVMCFPSITTSVLLLYENYDCNCQKVFGGFAAIISCAFAIYTFMIYQFRCFRSIGFGNACIPSEPQGDARLGQFCDPGLQLIQRNFWAGPGWIALAVACGLKILDMCFNLAIPTPTICRDLEEQRQYELLYGQVDDEDDER